jgi:hypothetical protein
MQKAFGEDLTKFIEQQAMVSTFINKTKCRIIGHDWFTEFGSNELPIYRLCHCCGKYQQPILSHLHFVWAKIEPGSITERVLKYRTKIEINLIKSI